MALSSVPLSCEFYPSVYPSFSTLPLQFREIAACCLGFTTCTIAWEFSLDNELSQYQGFLSLLANTQAWCLCCMMSNALKKNLCFNYFICFVIISVKSSLCYIILVRRSTVSSFKLKFYHLSQSLLRTFLPYLPFMLPCIPSIFPSYPLSQSFSMF